MYHSMDATIGRDTNQLWLFAGTGDYERINDTKAGVDNLLLGIKDPDYPFYKKINKASSADTIKNCTDTTGNLPGSACIKSSKRGWYVKLKDYGKVTAEPTVFKGLVYLSLIHISEPTRPY